MRYWNPMIILSAAFFFLTGCAENRSVYVPGHQGYRINTATARGEVYSVLMNKKVSVDWDCFPLREAIEQLSADGDFAIVAEWSTGIPGEEMDPDFPIDFHPNNPVRMITALEEALAASESETDWCLDEGFIRIGTKEALNDRKYLVVYPMTDLLKDSPFFAGLDETERERLIVQFKMYRLNVQDKWLEMRGGGCCLGASTTEWDEGDFAGEVQYLMTQLIEPNQWERNGGEGGSIRYFEGALFVNASDYIHRQVGGYRFGAATVLVH